RVRPGVEAGGDRRRAPALALARRRRRLEAALGRAVLEPLLQREERLGADVDALADVRHVEIAERVAVRELELARADGLDQERRERVRAERREQIAPLLHVLER